MIVKRLLAALLPAILAVGIAGGAANAYIVKWHGRDNVGASKSQFVPRDGECDGNGVYGNAQTNRAKSFNGWDGNGCKSGGHVYPPYEGQYWYKVRVCEDTKGCSSFGYP